MIGGNNPDLMLARQQLEQRGTMTPGLRLRLVGQGVDPSSIEAEASQGALSGAGPGAGPDTQGALATEAPMSNQQPVPRQPGQGNINRGPGAAPPEWAPPVGQAQDGPPPQPSQPPASGTPPGALDSPAAVPTGPEPATSSVPGAAEVEAEQKEFTPPNPQEIAERVQRAPTEQKAEIAKQLQNKGIDVEKAYTEWMEKLGGEVAPNLKLTKQEKGLFLLEFGLRMMSGSARTGALDAAGQAGMGTLASYQGEMDRRKAEATAQSDKAQKGALALTGMEIDAQAKGPRGNDVLADDSGYAFYVGPNGEPVFLTEPDGSRVKLDPNMRSRGSGGQSVFSEKMQAYLSIVSGNNERPITEEMRREALAYAGSGMTRDQFRQQAILLGARARTQFQNSGSVAIPPGGTNTVPLMNWTQKNWDDWLTDYVDGLVAESYGGAMNDAQRQAVELGERGLGNDTGATVPNPQDFSRRLNDE